MNVTAALAFALISLDANTIVVLTVLLLILGFIFFVYLLLRRTAQGFKEGMKQG
jgi:flagellar biogenesis protein FliO